VRRFWVCLTLAVLVPATAAFAAFPYTTGTPANYRDYRIASGAGQAPSDLLGKLRWMYAATAGRDSAVLAGDERELNGIRGAHLVDPADVDQAWRTTTGRPDVTISVLDSGIKWDDDGAMVDLRFKTRISRAEAREPNHARATATVAGVNCDTYTATGRVDPWDLNGDRVFNLRDYACDDRVDADEEHGVNPDMLDPQDVLIEFTDGVDDDDNGYPDDMVGWDFLDDDNDPYDDVQYGHGTGEARDSGAEADNPVDSDNNGSFDQGTELGACPNCMQIHMRVGTSFIADVNRFAQAVIYSVDNDVLVVQEALGTLNKSRLAGDAIDYAWDRGVTVIASAADEAAQHNNWPSSYPKVILVNSVTHFDEEGVGPPSYLKFNGCTNFNAKIDLAIPSVSCSSDATGRAAGMAGLIYSAALNAHETGRLDAHPACDRADGSACRLSANEVKQLMASGILDGTPVADDVNFAQTPLGALPSSELRCPAPGCTDPFLSAPPTREGTTIPRSYPARKGHDQFYGYGRVNMNTVVDALVPPGAGTPDSRVPPEAEITSPAWYDHIDPDRATLPVEGKVWARNAPYTCRLLVAPGGYAGEEDFVEADSTVCDGTTVRSTPIEGLVGTVDIEELKGLFPPGQPPSFDGPEHGAGPQQPHNGRPNSDPYGFIVKIEATLTGADALTGQDRRKLFLHRDAELLPGWPKQLAGDSEASPVLADLDGDNRNELVVANSDGIVHVWKRDGSELEGFPVKTDPLPRQTSAGWVEGGIEPAAGAVLATPAVGDLDRDGEPEIVVADLEGKVSVFAADGRRIRTLSTNPDYAGVPVEPFVNTRRGKLNRTQLGFIGSPVLADLDRDDGGKLEIVAAAMDRHVYAWNDDGESVPGWPVLVVDRSKVSAVDPVTHRVTFKPGVGAGPQQGAIVDTPAVGDLDGTDGDGRPEVVVGTNESYEVKEGPNPEEGELEGDENDGEFNAGGTDTAEYSALGAAALSLANGRLFTIEPTGEPDDDLLGGDSPYREGWPFKVGILQAEVLPLVGEGITGSPVIGAVACTGEAQPGPKVGTIPAAGIAYLVGPDGESCYGRDPEGRDNALPSKGGNGTAAEDQPFLAAFGHPAFGSLTGGGLSFLAPAAGLKRAVDVVSPEYQGGKDQLVAWQPETRSVRPGWPAEVNDLQFLTGPSVADIDGLPGEEIVAGTSSMDLQAFSAAGTDVPGWPKLTGDWTVANPAIGSFGTLDTDEDARRVVVGSTRSGRVLAYAVDAEPCAAASWPQFHHDRANSGDARRDAVAPGTPAGAALSGGSLTFTAPGNDLLCRTVAGYEVRTSDEPIDGDDFARLGPVAATGEPVEAGEKQTLSLPEGQLKRYVAVRAVDEQGNVGRLALVGREPPGGGGGNGNGNGSGGGGDTGRPGQPGQPGAGGPPPGQSRRSTSRRQVCLPRNGRLTSRGFGRVARLGARVTVVAGRRVITRCVTGGGRLITVLRGDRIRFVVSTAPGHRANRAWPGRRLSDIRRAYPRLSKLSPGLYRPYKRSRIGIRVRRGRVTAIAVFDRRLARDPKRLAPLLRRALR
jgi:hypothetical protein